MIDGRRFEYFEGNGKDLGDFHGEAFIQRCVRVDRSDTPLSVYFRPDRAGIRVEVVFELGRLWGKSNENAAHLGTYHATISQGSRVLAEIDVTKHWWMSRWRWQSSPRPVIHTPDALIKERLLPPYSSQVASDAKAVKLAKCIYNAPMDTAGIETDVSSAGRSARHWSCNRISSAIFEYFKPRSVGCNACASRGGGIHADALS